MKIQPKFIITIDNSPRNETQRAQTEETERRARSYFTIWEMGRQHHNMHARTDAIFSVCSVFTSVACGRRDAIAKSESNHVCGRHVSAAALQISCHVYNIYLPVRFPFFRRHFVFSTESERAGVRIERDAGPIAEGSAQTASEGRRKKKRTLF